MMGEAARVTATVRVRDGIAKRLPGAPPCVKTDTPARARVSILTRVLSGFAGVACPCAHAWRVGGASTPGPPAQHHPGITGRFHRGGPLPELPELGADLRPCRAENNPGTAARRHHPGITGKVSSRVPPGDTLPAAGPTGPPLSEGTRALLFGSLSACLRAAILKIRAAVDKKATAPDGRGYLPGPWKPLQRLQDDPTTRTPGCPGSRCVRACEASWVASGACVSAVRAPSGPPYRCELGEPRGDGRRSAGAACFDAAATRARCAAMRSGARRSIR